MRSDVAPFHFVNPKITSSDGNLTISRNFSSGISGNINNLNLIKTITETIPGINSTTVTVTSTEIPITTKEFINLPIGIQQNSELVPSIKQLSLASIGTDKPLLPSSTLSSLSAVVSDINEQACIGIQCQNNGTCIAGNDGRVNFNFHLL